MGDLMHRVMVSRSVFALFFAAAGLSLLLAPVAAHASHLGQDGPGFVWTSSEMLSEAQSILRMDGYLARGSYRSGELDDPTRKALKKFQRDHGLPVRGTLDWETMAELDSHKRPAVDSDGDGVIDNHDRCPDTPKGATVDAEGCPKDSDGDGVYDGLDRCPGTPKGATVDTKGCPSDADKDGVYDGIDRCPGTPKGATVDAKGCPKDTDGDGVYDGLDQCPSTPKGDKVDARGCSKPKPAPIAVKESLVLEGVNFELNSATLTAASTTALDRVVKSLKDWPDIRVEIGGHTDSTGQAAYNLQLSKKRADAVRDYLVSKGIKSSRVEAKGYGQKEPIADNATREGRAKNRRVELKRIN